MNKEILYEDELITILKENIVFKNYFLPFKKQRTVTVESIEKMELLEPTLLNGKYRLSGTGNFKDWFPADYSRSRKDKIFRLTMKKKYWRIGFTVEDSKKVINIFRKMKLV